MKKSRKKGNLVINENYSETKKRKLNVNKKLSLEEIICMQCDNEDKKKENQPRLRSSSRKVPVLTLDQRGRLQKARGTRFHADQRTRFRLM